MKAFFVATEIGTGIGGIQTWAYYFLRFLEHEKYRAGFFSLKNITVLSVCRLLAANLFQRFFILMDWKKAFFVLPSLILSSLFFRKSVYVIVVHGDEIFNIGMKRFFLRYLCRRKNVFFIANSKAVAELFRKKTGRKIDQIVYPFMDIYSFVGRESVKKKKNPVFTISTVTRLASRKNIISVVKAVAKLRRQGITVRYIIAGDGPEKDRIRQEIDRSGLEKLVLMKGSVTEDEKIKIVSSSDLFVLPSKFDRKGGSIEGFGIVFIEANMLGVPCISGNTGGMTEAVQNEVTGFHCSGVVDDICKSITKAISFKFNRKEIIAYSKTFDYREQSALKSFLIEING